MGKGNVCTFGAYEGLFFVDEDNIVSLYSLKNEDSITRLEFDKLNEDDQLLYEYDEISTQERYCQFVDNFCDDFIRICPSFERVKNRHYDVIMENKIFEIKVVDNQWSYAFMLIQKEHWMGDVYAGLQKKHYKSYLNKMAEALFKQVSSLGTYKGAWTSGTLSITEWEANGRKAV